MEHIDKMAVSAIKIAVGNIQSQGLSAKLVMINSIEYLFQQYEIERDVRFLRQALPRIQAYMELGFSYDENKVLFEKIFRGLDRTCYDYFNKSYMASKKVNLTKLQIRSMIGKWNPQYHSMSISDVVNDIIEKVENKKIGTYQYYSGKKTEQINGKFQYNTYELIIEADTNLFYDMNHNKYYEIIG